MPTATFGARIPAPYDPLSQKWFLCVILTTQSRHSLQRPMANLVHKRLIRKNSKGEGTCYTLY